MQVNLPYIVYSEFKRIKNRSAERGYVIREVPCEIRECASEEFTPVATIPAFRDRSDETVTIMHADGRYYAPAHYDFGRLVSAPITVNDVSNFGGNRGVAWLTVLKGYVRVSVANLEYRSIVQTFESHKTMYSYLAGEDDGKSSYGSPTVKFDQTKECVDVLNTGGVTEIAARRAYERSVFIDGVLHRECDEPRYVAEVAFYGNAKRLDIDVALDNLKHGVSDDLNCVTPYKSPFNKISFRLDRFDDLEDYIQARHPDEELPRFAQLAELHDPSVLHFDDEADHLVRIAQWAVDQGYGALKGDKTETVHAWVALRDQAFSSSMRATVENVSSLVRKIQDYANVTDDANITTQLRDALKRYSLGPIQQTSIRLGR